MSTSVMSISGSNTIFALELYGKLKTQRGNLIFSPFSISTALAMTWAGARGATEIEMARTLHFGTDQEKIHVGFQDLTRRINGNQRPGKITLFVANSLWPQKEHHMQKTFLDLIESRYGAEAHEVDFMRQPKQACASINRWIEEKTRNQIKEVIDPEAIGRETVLVLCNAIYFKGAWETLFDKNKTLAQPFMIDTNQTVTVQMMRQDAKVKTAASADGGVELLELPYSGGDFSMLILLPRSQAADDLAALETKFSADNLRIWLGLLDAARPQKISIALPRFTITQSFGLSEALKSMGMVSAFGAGANFSGMDGSTGLYISAALHKARIEVNEEGTKAAAATAVVMSKSKAAGFVVNRPFLFLIRDNGSGSILFMGRIVDPTK